MFIKSAAASTPNKTDRTYMPYTQLITLCTYQKNLTLGTISNTRGISTWNPSSWGQAAEKSMPQLQSFSNVIFIDTYSIMPNHIHMLVIFRNHQPRLTNWFVSYSKQTLAQRMMRVRPAIQPVWDAACTAQPIHCPHTQSAISLHLQEHRDHWQYDTLYMPNPKSSMP